MGGENEDQVVERTESMLHGEVESHRLHPTTTHRGLKTRHAQMIALGGTIGTGLFVGSGQALQMGGPLFLLLSYIILTVLVFGVATATGEMSAYLPVGGSAVNTFGSRFVSKSLGFALGWVYWYSFAITVPAEINTSTLIINYWENPVPTAVWLTIIGVVMIACNCFPVRVYGEAEFWFASSKVIAILGLLILTVVLFFGGGPTHDPLYFRYWGNPGPVNEYLVSGDSGRLCGFVATLTFSVYAFAFAPELLVVTGGEMESPRRNVPKATIRYFYRLIVFYVLGAIGITILVPSNYKGLLTAGSDAAASPWAIGIKDAGIKVLDSVINAVIVLSSWSAGNSYLYLASRALYSMAVDGNAPKIFARCTKSGVPYYATAASASFSLLAYLNLASTGSTVFNWFVNLINCGGYISWICCCLIYIFYRRAMDTQGITDIPFRSRFQPYIAWVSMIVFFILLLLQGFQVFIKDQWNTATFITAYAGIVIFICLYFGHRLTVGRGDKWALHPKEVDLHTGLEDILALEGPAPPKPKWWQMYKVLYE